mmetsp:Transcript_30991/g.51369  ORF Transcript_30991/g.51369 Transcript_30991/m.51369 type:complete len:154 (-) Transcript_30991:374-835(-)
MILMDFWLQLGLTHKNHQQQQVDVWHPRLLRPHQHQQVPHYLLGAQSQRRAILLIAARAATSRCSPSPTANGLPRLTTCSSGTMCRIERSSVLSCSRLMACPRLHANAAGVAFQLGEARFPTATGLEDERGPSSSVRDERISCCHTALVPLSD